MSERKKIYWWVCFFVFFLPHLTSTKEKRGTDGRLSVGTGERRGPRSAVRRRQAESRNRQTSGGTTHVAANSLASVNVSSRDGGGAPLRPGFL